MHPTRTIADVMTRSVHTLRPDDTIILAARTMDELDIGVVPVLDGERLVGLVTDRDIVLRAVARELGPDSTLRDIMSHEVVWCYEDEPVDDVLDDMVQRQIRRVPVLDRQRQLVGMLSLGDIAAKTQNAGIGGALGEISLPAAPRRRNAAAMADELPEVVNAELAEVNLGRS
ncbi:CBS domain-containing protein [Herbaspirillum sp. alder98]|uniref:CBS domain-containing protein n=1 Tax=Herbaspirillum sp. alder98 TaxID=2913096 RepID=UPI001CD87DA5|nr:CBS domain-containing protein [Herbaspirillum sp. alder98]MCA1323638.1 CBS domain-containing protein [Herbaspirillum sp. alder98]